MQTIHSETDIDLAVIQLEKNLLEEEEALRHQISFIHKSIKPINILKTTFKEAAASQDLKSDFLKTVVGIAAGYLTKVVLESVTDNPAKKVVGTAIIFGAAEMIVNNPDAIKSAGRMFFNALRTGQQRIHIEATDTP